jgi:hypothetical protein
MRDVAPPWDSDVYSAESVPEPAGLLSVHPDAKFGKPPHLEGFD